MKVKEFVELIKSYDDIQDWDLVVVTSDISIGAQAFVNIKTACPGFDWDHGKMQIYTDTNIKKDIQKITPCEERNGRASRYRVKPSIPSTFGENGLDNNQTNSF